MSISSCAQRNMHFFLHLYIFITSPNRTNVFDQMSSFYSHSHSPPLCFFHSLFLRTRDSYNWVQRMPFISFMSTSFAGVKLSRYLKKKHFLSRSTSGQCRKTEDKWLGVQAAFFTKSHPWAFLSHCSFDLLRPMTHKHAYRFLSKSLFNLRKINSNVLNLFPRKRMRWLHQKC